MNNDQLQNMIAALLALASSVNRLRPNSENQARDPRWQALDDYKGFGGKVKDE